MISLHMKPDVNTSVTWEVVVNNETSTPIGEIHVYDLGHIELKITNITTIDMRVLADIVKAFPIRMVD